MTTKKPTQNFPQVLHRPDSILNYITGGALEHPVRIPSFKTSLKYLYIFYREPGKSFYILSKSKSH